MGFNCLAWSVLEKVNLGSVWVETVFVSEAHLVHLVWPSMVLPTTASLTDPTVAAPEKVSKTRAQSDEPQEE